MHSLRTIFGVFPHAGIVSLLILAVSLTGTIAIAQSGGTLTPTGNLTTPRAGHNATLLTNGKDLITGGWADSTVLASAELYDPPTGTFTPTGEMTTVRACHTATLLPNGKVLIAGGQSKIDYSGSALSSTLATTELYDPATGTLRGEQYDPSPRLSYRNSSQYGQSSRRRRLRR
jgi:hypothetical protein